MNRDEILSLEAGREMDALVAERVMGWQRLGCGYFGGEDETPLQLKLESWMDSVGITDVGSYWIDVEQNFWMKTEDWHPSVDIAAAWQVVEELVMRGTAVDIHHRNPTITRCEMTTPHPVAWTCHFMAGATTVQLAICRAALLATLEADDAIN